MSFDDNLYKQLLDWANSLLKSRKIDNLTEYDLINEAYLMLLSGNKIITADEVRRIAFNIFRMESGLSSSKDNNWLRIGEGNPNYKIGTRLLSHYVCKICRELKPQAEFTVRNRDGVMTVQSRCKVCVNKIALDKRLSQSGYTIKPTTSLTVYNENGEIVYRNLSVADVAYRLGISKYRVRKIIRSGKRHKNIFKYRKQTQNEKQN